MATFLYMPQYCGPLAAFKTSCSKLLRSALLGGEVQWCCCLLPGVESNEAVELNCSLPLVCISRLDTQRRHGHHDGLGNHDAPIRKLWGIRQLHSCSTSFTELLLLGPLVLIRNAARPRSVGFAGFCRDGPFMQRQSRDRLHFNCIASFLVTGKHKRDAQVEIKVSQASQGQQSLACVSI